VSSSRRRTIATGLLLILSAPILTTSAFAAHGIPYRHAGHHLSYSLRHAMPRAHRHYGYSPYRHGFHAPRHFSFHRSFAYRPYGFSLSIGPRYAYRPLTSVWSSCPPYSSYYSYGYLGSGYIGPGYGSVTYSGVTPLPSPGTAGSRRADLSDPLSVPMPDWRGLVAVHRAMADKSTASARAAPETGEFTLISSVEGDEGEYLALGDRLFRERFYSSALEQYEAAASAASVLAAPYFRQGYALVALQDYERAANAFRRGLGVDPSYLRSEFRSAELYGDGLATRTQHVEAVAAAVLESAGLESAGLKSASDRNLLFVIGILLQFEGNADRATIFFERARDPDPEPELVLD
jgi:tetratricopeptide (TPR) repeat protein